MMAELLYLELVGCWLTRRSAARWLAANAAGRWLPTLKGSGP